MFKKCKAFSWTGSKFFPQATDDNPFPKEYYKNTTCYFYERGKHIEKSSFKESEGESISGIKSKCLQEYTHKDPQKPGKISLKTFELVSLAMQKRRVSLDQRGSPSKKIKRHWRQITAQMIIIRMNQVWKLKCLKKILLHLPNQIFWMPKNL